MSAINELLAVLDRWDAWKRIKEAPSRIDDLEKRLLILEEKLGNNRTENLCAACGKYEMRPYGEEKKLQGRLADVWRCNSCERTETRFR